MTNFKFYQILKKSREYDHEIGNKQFHTNLSVLFIITLLVASFFPTMTLSQSQATTFKTPQALAQASIDTPASTLNLLNNESFKADLKTIAQKLSPELVDSEALFNRVALLSIREDIEEMTRLIEQQQTGMQYLHYSLHAEVSRHPDLTATPNANSFEQLLTSLMSERFRSLSDETLFRYQAALGWSVDGAQQYVHNIFKGYQTLTSLSEEQVIQLIVNTHLYHILANVIPVTDKLIKRENQTRYFIEPNRLITTAEGIEHSVTIVKKKNAKSKMPTAFQFTIYADEKSHIQTAIHAAAHGYVGVIANSRGKRLSTNKIVPWKHEGKDANAVIDWISKQSWSDGQVAMYGGSYNGFTQWAAAKYMHPALKTIVPYAAASPITGLPIENNIYLTGNYQWAFHVTNNKTMDSGVYADWQKTNKLTEDLYKSGRSLSEIDKIDGTANPWFQKWLKHPSYDKFYQDMLPYEKDYERINIPVLSFTGYFDGGQISAIDFLSRHHQFNDKANHTLVIGPYNHITAQGVARSHHSNYELDQVALKKDTEEMALQWFDHVLFGKEKPQLIKDKVNYQLMGSNSWQHSNSYRGLNDRNQQFFLTKSMDDENTGLLLTKPTSSESSFMQKVDLADRSEERNQIPWPLIKDELDNSNGLTFVTEPFTSPQHYAGAVTGSFNIAINKKDVDIGFNLYEQTKEGKYFHLTRYIGRASYAKNMSKRELLTPNSKTEVPIVNGRMTAKLIEKGSRLVLVLNVNKNRAAQVNMGTGKDVSFESVEDAGEPLNIKWFSDSKIFLPIIPWEGNKN
jgi:putative CocE/NonD family hydrolase